VRAQSKPRACAGRTGRLWRFWSAIEFHAPPRFQDALPPALALGDRALLGSVHRAGQLSEEQRLDPETVAAAVRQGRERRARPAGSGCYCRSFAAEARPGDLLAGGCPW